jgi:Multicopper oxidase
LVDLSDGAAFELRIGAVTKRLGDATVRMLAYNDSIPGPTLRVAQGSEVEVNVVNEGDMDATVHWHGLRLENRYDGTHERALIRSTPDAGDRGKHQCAHLRVMSLTAWPNRGPGGCFAGPDGSTVAWSGPAVVGIGSRRSGGRSPR